MCWLTPYDWTMWALLLVGVVTLLVVYVDTLPRTVVLYLLFDVARGVFLARPATLCAPTEYAEWWWTLKYFDYAFKIMILVWAGWRLMRPLRRLTAFYAGTGTAVLVALAWRVGSPFASSQGHNSAMVMLALGANILCCFLGLYIGFMTNAWDCEHRPAFIVLGLMTWTVLTTTLGFVQLHHPEMWSLAGRGYPLAEALMLAAWWWALRTRNDGRSRYLVPSRHGTGRWTRTQIPR